MLPLEMWKMILYHAFIGQEGSDTDTLENCRKVCREWNEMIKRSVWKKPNKEWGIITKSMIEKKWVFQSFPSNKMVAHAKSLGKRNKNKLDWCSAMSSPRTGILFLIMFDFEQKATSSWLKVIGWWWWVGVWWRM